MVFILKWQYVQINYAKFQLWKMSMLKVMMCHITSLFCHLMQLNTYVTSKYGVNHCFLWITLYTECTKISYLHRYNGIMIKTSYRWFPRWLLFSLQHSLNKHYNALSIFLKIFIINWESNFRFVALFHYHRCFHFLR